jgi:predicted aspartyl protease
MIGLIAFAAAASQPQSAPAQIAANPYGAAAQAATGADALIREAVFGTPGATARLADWLEAHPDALPEQRSTAFAVLCNVYGAYTWHALRATACASAPKTEDDDDEAVARALAETPPVRAAGSVRVPLTWSDLGIQTVVATVDDVELPWIVDTGAEISVLSQSSADRIKPHYVQGQFSIGTTTEAVSGRVAVVDLLHIGSATVENVPVLVLPDAQLAVGGGRVIPAILGLQVLNAFHRVAWLDHARYLALGEAAPHSGAGSYRLYWHEDGAGIPVETAAGKQGAFLDTGANASFLRPSGLALLSPAERSSAVQKKVGIGGAGGMVTRMQAQYPRLRFSVAGSMAELDKVPMALRDDQGAAQFGIDLVKQFDLFLLDFERMRIVTHRGPPVPKTAR